MVTNNGEGDGFFLWVKSWTDNGVILGFTGFYRIAGLRLFNEEFVIFLWFSK